MLGTICTARYGAHRQSQRYEQYISVALRKHAGFCTLDTQREKAKGSEGKSDVGKNKLDKGYFSGVAIIHTQKCHILKFDRPMYSSSPRFSIYTFISGIINIFLLSALAIVSTL